MTLPDGKGLYRKAAIGAVLFCLAGCASRFLPVDGSAAGPAHISGRAYVQFSDRQRNCDDILLVPQTGQYRKIVSENFADGEAKLLQDIKFIEIFDDLGRQGDIKSVYCDGSGEFSFSHLADGDYYLIARSTWLLRLAHRGGIVFRQIHVPQDGDGITVVASVGGE